MATRTGKDPAGSQVESTSKTSAAKRQELAGESSLPKSLRIDVTLPEESFEVPEDEEAVAIEETPVQAGKVLESNLSTTSIELIPVVPIPDPESERSQTRGRRNEPAVPQTPEPTELLTSDRLLERNAIKKPKPEGFWQSAVYSLSLHLVNLGDSKAVRARKEMDARISRKFDAGTRFIAVLSRKGGVGKTTISTLLGMALAEVRDDPVIAVDANPDRGTLAERVKRRSSSTVRDVVSNASQIKSFSEFSNLVTRDETRLDVLASDADPTVSEAFDAKDFDAVADAVSRFYSIAIADCGTGIVLSVMQSVLRRADALVIISGGSVDEARLASETLTWLETNGYAQLARNSVVALNTATPATSLVNLDEIETHFRSRVREIVRIPYDPLLATGAAIDFRQLRPLTVASARLLAAAVADGIPLADGH
ncbi:MAG: MinD/ParA family protein [Homoserinimonas sp.]|nr:MinD/ParA family protein [Homoserinimonas sp.]